MRDFQDIAQQYDLKKFLDSPHGTLFFAPLVPGRPRLLVRRFDRDWTPDMIEPFVTLVRAAQHWVERHGDLQSLLRVDQPTEVGSDFVARRHHLYHVSLDSYEGGEIDPPEQLSVLRDRLRAETGAPADEREAVIESALARSVLEPTDKTFWKNDEARFVIVEPRVTTDLLKRWSALT